MTTGNILSNLF